MEVILRYTPRYYRLTAVEWIYLRVYKCHDHSRATPTTHRSYAHMVLEYKEHVSHYYHAAVQGRKLYEQRRTLGAPGGPLTLIR